MHPRSGVSTLAPENPDRLLRVSGLSAYYGELRALNNITLEIRSGEICSIIGANGAGKSTLLKSIVGMMQRGQAARTTGRVEFRGRRIDNLPTERVVNTGITMIPEGRRLFSRLTVEENLMTGAFLARCRPRMRELLDDVYTLFPVLEERRSQVVSQLSGGQQQMVAIGRALMSDPELILFDELSLGLAPLVVDDIYQRVRELHQRGLTAIVIEQDMKRALSVADNVFVMLEGRVVLQGSPQDLTEEQVTAAYFGSDIGTAA